MYFAIVFVILGGIFLFIHVDTKPQQYNLAKYSLPKSRVAPKYGREDESGEQQDLSNVPGEPGVDFPIYHQVPQTRFSCGNVPFLPGMYANMETGCQAYHVCHDGREGHQGAAFLCSNGTLFNQKEFACDWWYNVDCKNTAGYYELNGDVEKNPFVPKRKVEEETENAYQHPYRSSEYIKKNRYY